MNEIKITPEIKKLAEEYLEECPYSLHNKEAWIELTKRINKRINEENK